MDMSTLFSSSEIVKMVKRMYKKYDTKPNMVIIRVLKFSSI